MYTSLSLCNRWCVLCKWCRPVCPDLQCRWTCFDLAALWWKEHPDHGHRKHVANSAFHYSWGRSQGGSEGLLVINNSDNEFFNYYVHLHARKCTRTKRLYIFFWYSYWNWFLLFRLKWVEEEIQKPSFGQGWESWPHLLEKVLWGKVQWLWKPVKLLNFFIFLIYWKWQVLIAPKPSVCIAGCGTWNMKIITYWA